MYVISFINTSSVNVYNTQIFITEWIKYKQKQPIAFNMLKDFVTTIQTHAHVNLMCSVKMLLLFIPYETFPTYIYCYYSS